jgi:hypothetical protein
MRWMGGGECLQSSDSKSEGKGNLNDLDADGRITSLQ